MKLKQFLLITLSITFFTCSTESVNNPEEEENTDSTLIKKIVYDKGTANEYTETFNYEGNKLTSVDAGDGYKNIYTYDSDNNLIKDDFFEKNELIASVSLEYNSDDKVAMYIETFFEGSGLSDRQYKHVLTYNNDGTITSKVYGNYNGTGFQLDFTEIITLDGKNILEVSHNDGYKIAYTYDKKNNAFKNIHAIEVLNMLSENEFGSLIYGNTNNILSFIESGASSYNYIDTYEYTYNENDYPKTCIYSSKYGNQTEDIETIEYFYE